jgi:pimeloyl-ACP methyl ester carboxylesterase
MAAAGALRQFRAPTGEGSSAAMTDPSQAAWPKFKSEAGRARYDAAYDAVLREWPVDFQELDAPTRFGPTHVIACGRADAPPLILLPSFAGSATVWRLNVDDLSRQFRVYAVDVIGQPGKSRAIRRLRIRRDYAGWYADLLDGLGVGRASIVGCSFGGFLALSQAMLTPERVDRLVLVSPAGSFVGLSWRFIYAMRIKGPVLRLVRRLTGNKRAPSLADLTRRLPRDRLWGALIATTMKEAPKVSIINACVFARSDLAKVRAQTLLLIGDQETLYPPQATLDLARKRMPSLKTALVTGADHIAAMAQPEAVNGLIIAFLQEQAAPA